MHGSECIIGFICVLSVLILVTQPEARTDKSDNTQKNRALIVLMYVTAFCTCAYVLILNVLSMHI